jgi:hypothetical protein
MIKTFLKQLILEKCIDTLFSNIQENLHPYKSRKYIFQSLEDTDGWVCGKISYIYNNTEYQSMTFYPKNFCGFGKCEIIQLCEKTLVDGMYENIKYQGTQHVGTTVFQ